MNQATNSNIVNCKHTYIWKFQTRDNDLGMYVWMYVKLTIINPKIIDANLTTLWSYLLHLLKHASHSLLHLFELAKSFLHFVKSGQFLLHLSQGSLQLCNFIIPWLTWSYLKVCDSILATSATWAWTKSNPTNTAFALLTHHFGKHIIRCQGWSQGGGLARGGICPPWLLPKNLLGTAVPT